MMGYPPPPGIPTTGHHLPMPAPPGSSLTPILNFLITLSGTSVPETLQGLMMLLEELPAEISFHVPETYHKRIIGVGGRTIQRIMKKYGVFVKFFNGSAAEGDFGGNANGQSPETDVDREGNTGSPPTPVGNGDAEDNVVARTPAKNAANLENLKVAVLELVNPQVLGISQWMRPLLTPPCSRIGQGLHVRDRRDPEEVSPHPAWREEHIHQGHRDQDRVQSGALLR